MILYVVFIFFCMEGHGIQKPPIQKKLALQTQNNLSFHKNSIDLKNQSIKHLNHKIYVAKAPLSEETGSKSKQKAKGNPGSGYKISQTDPGRLLKKMRLKKGDIIYSINGKNVHSKKQIYSILLLMQKLQKKSLLLVARNNQHFLISYSPFKPNEKITISSVKKIKDRRKLASLKDTLTSEEKDPTQLTDSTPPKKETQAQLKNTSSPEEHKSVRQKESLSSEETTKEKSKQSLVPTKYKEHLQLAYVIAVNSFVYKKPDFDSPQLYSLAPGERVLVSKKIFRPPHRFGSFYKVFVTQPKKIVGYISEVEVAPKFIKQKEKYKINPAYKIAKKQLQDNKVLDIDLIDKINQNRRIPKSKSRSNKKRYTGLSMGFLFDSLLLDTPSNPFAKENILVGLKFSGYKLLLPSINLDLNFTFTPLHFSSSPPYFKFLHFDTLLAFPLVKSQSFYVFIMGGLKFDINRRNMETRINQNPHNFGLAGALSLLVPVRQNILFRADIKNEYGFIDKRFLPSFLSAIQVSF